MAEVKKKAEILDIPEEAALPGRSAPKRAAKSPAKSRSTQKKTKKPAGEPAKKPVRATAKKPVRAAAGKPAKQTAKKSAKSVAAKAAKAAPAPRANRDRTAAVNLLLCAGILAFMALGGLLVHQHERFLAMKRVVENQTFYEGTTVEGVDVSGQTFEAAREHWRTHIEPVYEERTVTLDGAGAVTAAQLGYHSDYDAVLYAAWSAGRSGSLEERYRSAVSRQYHPMAWQVHRRIWSDEAVDAYVAAVAGKLDVPAVDAEIASFDAEAYAFVLTESRQGRRLDAEKLKSDITSALEAGGGDVTLSVLTVEPQVTQDEVTSKYGMISSAVTNASSSSSNRLRNIKNAVSLINGYRLRDGATFSFNEAVGERTTDRGFRKATAYSGGDVTEEVGGGICQVSTTLFNAAVKADMEIVERHNHSLTVSYVDRGKDATVSWDSQDLRFTNHSGDDVYICCFVSEDKRVRFAIFGRLLPNGETITLESRTTETIKYDTEYQLNAFLMPGETQVLSEGKNGYKAEAWKIRWDAAGNEISKELLCKSVYKKRNEVIQYGK